MIVIAVVLFMVLALGEDIVGGFLARRQHRAVVTGATTAVGKTIAKYNQILIQAYKQDKPSLLMPVATERQITDVRLYMTYQEIEKKRKLINVLKDLRIDKTKTGKTKATAWTNETWEYYYIDMQTRKEFGRTTESYKVTYQLIKMYDAWQVDRLTAKKI